MNDTNDLKPGERLVEGRIEGKEQTVQVAQTASPEQIAAAVETVRAQQQAHATQTELDRLTLHEERPKISIVKESAGAVTIRKLVKERTETLPVTLVSEVLEITVNHSGTGKVLLDGQPLEVGRTYEVLLQDERAIIQKEVYPVADINLRKQSQIVTHTEQIVLQREELDVHGDTELVREIEATDHQP